MALSLPVTEVSPSDLSQLTMQNSVIRKNKANVVFISSNLMSKTINEMFSALRHYNTVNLK